MENKWLGLEGDTYRIENLGRPGIFLLPSHKLRQEMEGTTVEDHLHNFLIENFGAFTTTMVPYFGFWHSTGNKRIDYDECRQYEVSFDGKKLIPVLLAKLAEIARVIDEECIYVKAGQYSALIYPV